MSRGDFGSGAPVSYGAVGGRQAGSGLGYSRTSHGGYQQEGMS